MVFYPELLDPALRAEDFETRRRELVDVLARNEYGFMPEDPDRVLVTDRCAPEDTFCGHATVYRQTLTCAVAGGEFSFPFVLYVPKSERPVPAFAFMNFRRDEVDRYFPAEEIIDAGFAVAMVCYTDVENDDNAPPTGLQKLFARKNDGTDPGRISVWAWAQSRLVDVLAGREDVDADNIAVIGHSRLGKTALWCAANDTRVRYAVSNDSGCSGAAYERVKHPGSETLADITKVFPHWFCENFPTFAGRENERPFDQHFLIAACAPRYVLVGSASLDAWADPASERLSLVAASPAWELLGKRGFVGKTVSPKVG
ncbi:MAG: acetylxylan esterase, partial [Clostridia bacterium]|nr:acetylxylan esterase [Clostridia bacterium]